MLPAGFDIRAIQIFVLVVDLGGMTPAASSLGISQSAVSQAIASLEKSTNMQLFNRNIRPISLTSAGDRLYLHGNTLLTAAKNTFNEVRSKELKSFSNVTIAMFESFANTIGHLITRDLSDQFQQQMQVCVCARRIHCHSLSNINLFFFSVSFSSLCFFRAFSFFRA